MTPPSWQAVSRSDALVDGHTYANRNRIRFLRLYRQTVGSPVRSDPVLFASRIMLGADLSVLRIASRYRLWKRPEMPFRRSMWGLRGS
jgi:hypothetical protein